MTKESKALNTIFGALQYFLREKNIYYLSKEELGDAATILRDAIDEYQYMKNVRYVLLGGRMGNKSARYDILAKLKALKIIVKKNVDIGRIKHTIEVAIENKATLVNAKTKEFIKPYIYYNMSRPESERLTEVEYDIVVECCYENTLVRSLALCNNKIQKGKKV